MKSALNRLLRWERVPAAKLGGALTPGACPQMVTVQMLPVCPTVSQTGFSLEQCVLLSSRTELKRGQLDSFRDWFAEIRPVGSVALKLAFTAAARGDVWISTAPKSEWDVCGGHVLVREAGGEFVVLAEGERTYNQQDILLQPVMAAGPPALIREIRERQGQA